MIDYERFSGKLDGSAIDTDRQKVIMSWLNTASNRDNTFERFMFRWMSFNGWLACVTGEQRDAKMLSSFSSDNTAVTTFKHLMLTSPKFTEGVDAFVKLWPIFNAADVLKLGDKRPRAMTMMERPAYVRALLPLKKIRRRPGAWNPDNATAPQIQDVFDAIYQVRCNLFHGDKVSYVEIDRELIRHADTCLRMWIDESHCYTWPEKTKS